VQDGDFTELDRGLDRRPQRERNGFAVEPDAPHVRARFDVPQVPGAAQAQRDIFWESIPTRQHLCQ
jgi:hypothetical protein